LKKKYKIEKAVHDAFGKKKITQIPAIKTQTTREAIQRIEQAKIDDFCTNCARNNHSKKYQILGQPPPPNNRG
jgi:beta-lactam-binding protein with PASTA domain